MISRKTAKVRYTYEQIASARAQQLGSREESSVNDKIRMYKKWNLTMYKIVHN